MYKILSFILETFKLESSKLLKKITHLLDFNRNKNPIFNIGRANQNEKLFLDKDNNLIISKTGDKLVYLSFYENFGLLYSADHFIDFIELNKVDNEMKYFFVSRESKKIYCARPLGEELSRACVASRTQAKDWEKLELLIPLLLTPMHVQKDINKLLELWSAKQSLSNVFISIFNSKTKLKSSILNKLIGIMSNEELITVGKYFSYNTLRLTQLKKLLKNDLWMVHSIDELISFKNGNKFYTNLSSKLDFIANDAKHYPFDKNPWLTLNYFIRQAIKPTKQFCVVATAKNEGVYLLEWISYYLSLGAEAIFIYSNDNADASTELLKILAKYKIIHFIENNLEVGTSAQEKAYSHALTVSSEILDFKWSLFVDIDEFLVFNNDIFNSFSDFLDWHDHQSVDAIGINWVMNSGEINGDWFTQPITQRLKRFNNKIDRHIKTIFKPHFFHSSQPHFPRSHNRIKPVFRSPNGSFHTYKTSPLPSNTDTALADHPQGDHALILHFFNKTVSEYIWKFSRNRGDHFSFVEEGMFGNGTLQFLERFMNSIDDKNFINSEEYIKAPFNYLTIADQLLSIPEVKNAHKLIVDTTQKRYERISPLFWNYLEQNRSGSVNKFIDRYKPKN